MQEDIIGKTIIIDLKGKILLHDKIDDIWKVDMTNHFIIFKNEKGNVWDCRKNKFLLDKWYHCSEFSQDEFSMIFIPYKDKKYIIDSENTDTDIIKLIDMEENNMIIIKS